MDKVLKYQQTINQELEKWNSFHNSNKSDVKYQVIINAEKTNFLVIAFGWGKDEYHYQVLFHIELKEGKVWIHEDSTGIGIALSLQNAGIMKSDIILGFAESILEASKELVEA